MNIDGIFFCFIFGAENTIDTWRVWFGGSFCCSHECGVHAFVHVVGLRESCKNICEFRFFEIIGTSWIAIVSFLCPRDEFFVDLGVVAIKSQISPAECWTGACPAISVSRVRDNASFASHHLIFREGLEAVVLPAIVIVLCERNVNVNKGRILILHRLVERLDHQIVAILSLPSWIYECRQLSDGVDETVRQQGNSKQALFQWAQSCRFVSQRGPHSFVLFLHGLCSRHYHLSLLLAESRRLALSGLRNKAVYCSFFIWAEQADTPDSGDAFGTQVLPTCRARWAACIVSAVEASEVLVPFEIWIDRY